jgi:hypothetical protein
LEQNAMPTNLRFGQKFADSIVAVLGCHDRVIFRGHLPFGGDQQLNLWVDYGLKMRRKDFLPFVEKQSEALVVHAQQTAQAAQAPYQYLQGEHSKERIIEQQIHERKLSEGLVAVLCCLETCRTVKLLHGDGRPQLAFRRRPQRVLYYYFLDPTFGLVYVRLQTWFPFTIQVYVNGHEWLARQMVGHQLGFVQHDNAFVELDAPERAQRLADGFSKLRWMQILDDWAERFNILLDQDWLGQRRHYWVIDQAEYSTDLLFKSRAHLAALYPKLLDHAVLNFSAEDILTFLGRRLHPRFDGEVLTLCKKDRQRGARVKHRVKNNWLKMYDKFGQILRIETVINNPYQFKVRRWRTRHGQRQLVWCPMNKGVANFYHYHTLARAANQRYLDALAVVDRPCATAKQLDQISAAVRYRGRRRRGLNVLAATDQKLFLAALRGEHRLHGLRNRDVAAAFFPTPSNDAAEQRRRTAHVSRRLALLRAHGLIAKIPRSQRYRLTKKGEAMMNTAVYVRYKMFPAELSAAA